MDHSIQRYLERRTTKQLEAFLQWCQDNDKTKEYAYAIPIILNILAKRKRTAKKVVDLMDIFGYNMLA